MNVEDFGAVALLEYEGTIFTVPDLILENTTKKDGSSPGWYPEREMVGVGGKRQFPGGVRDETDPLSAICREIKEETRCEPKESSVEPLNVSTVIFHERDGDGGKYYGVDLFLWHLDQATMLALSLKGAVPVEWTFDNLRERDKIVYGLYKEVVSLPLSISSVLSQLRDVSI